MCESKAEGGRRCPGCEAAARQLGRAHARAARLPRPVPAGRVLSLDVRQARRRMAEDAAAAPQPGDDDDVEPGLGDPTAAVLAARRAVDDADAAGWDRPVGRAGRLPTAAALAAEAAVRKAGAAAEARIDLLAQPAVRAVIGAHATVGAWMTDAAAVGRRERDLWQAAVARGDSATADAALARRAGRLDRARAGKAKIIAARADALRVVLDEQAVPVGDRTLLAPRPPAVWVTAAVIDAGSEMPASWVARSVAASPPLTVAGADGSRGCYRTSAGELTLGVDADPATRPSAATHELAHRMVSTTPALQGLSATHHHVRAGREPVVQLAGYPPGEVAQIDHYGIGYCGRIYLPSPGDPGGSHDGAELLPVGLQALQHAGGGLRGEAGEVEDPELRHWTLGVLLAVR